MIAQIEATALGTAPPKAHVLSFNGLGVLIKISNQSRVFWALFHCFCKIQKIETWKRVAKAVASQRNPTDLGMGAN